MSNVDVVVSSDDMICLFWTEDTPCRWEPELCYSLAHVTFVLF